MLEILLLLEIIIPVLINVAFFTLFERKILGLIQNRKGPNKVSVSGVLQPFSDAIKLFLKESFKPVNSLSLYLWAPFFSLFLSLVSWSIIPLTKKTMEIEFCSIFLLVIFSLTLYPLLIAGWSSNSKYALLGSLRGVAQTLSYEISLALIIFSLVTMGQDYSMKTLTEIYFFISFFMLFPLFSMWLISCVAETNRTPFDFSEGESELVSGFNIEYGGGGFALIFMAEYAMIMFFSFISVQLFFKIEKMFMVSILGVFMCFFWVWLRGTYPRFRYDMLMNTAWKILLPMSLSMFIFMYLICLS